MPTTKRFTPNRNLTGHNSTSPTNLGSSTANTLSSLLQEMKKNFIDRDVEIMEGLTFNQYKLLTTIHFYLNSKFENGDLDENGNDKFFHNIINHRNVHTTKNIDLDTKDIKFKTDDESSFWVTWLAQMELRQWMRDENFASLLDQLASDLPKYGWVIWKKTKEMDEDDLNNTKVCIKNVDLRDFICDQAVNDIKESQVTAERVFMQEQDVRGRVKNSGWDEVVVDKFLSDRNKQIKKRQYMSSVEAENAGGYSLTDSLPSYDVYEMWGWIPESYLPEGMWEGDRPDPEKSKYVMAVIPAPDTSSASDPLFIEEASPEDYPYKACYMFKQPGRVAGIGNTELLIPLQIRMNELVNRFFMALRLGSVHLFQTRGKMLQKNLLQDAQDGDIVETTHPIDPIATEIRAFNQYQNEVASIEALADKICNTPEVVTGESMPAATPFRLGAQLGISAAKIFDFVRENCGIFVSEVLRDWVLPEISNGMTKEHVLELIGSPEELSVFFTAYRKHLMYEEVKKYVLKSWYLPKEDEFNLVEKALSEQMETADKKISIKEGFFTTELLDNAKIVLDPTGETMDQAAKNETLGNLLQIIASNPAVLQDPNTKMILGQIMEGSGISPLKIAGFISSPAQANPMADAAAPASQKFSQNPGDAGSPEQTGGQVSAPEKLMMKT